MECARLTARDVEWSLVGVLAATKSADVATTLVGLWTVPGVREVNPLVAGATQAVGVPVAVLALGVAAVVCITVVTEAGAAAVEATDRTPPWGPKAVRLTGYGLGSAVHLSVAAANVALLVSA
ncbi:hypothetical protein [Halobacterium bonnevillei]|uniref:DUF5658 domain-containing protein n=1 Tax=Halobacterium bonnevillei TaxID=2692200 RepID=A0A6B0SJE3_9EURY|nr:hypothetical protein [Halobacterium bonnevillei]MXR19633.1 hypothetical protein [Halobacterium bonnevillei]